jgi:hypothetical protein
MTSKFCAEDADQSIVADDTFDEEEVDDDDEDNIQDGSALAKAA